MVPPKRHQLGFTLLEMSIAVTILIVIAAIGIPQYVSALQTARMGKAEQELVTISHAIDTHAVHHRGRFPYTLHQVGFGGKTDPWGVPYCYLNYAAGTGDGMQWAIDAGIVDPAAFGSTDAGGGLLGGLGGGLFGGDVRGLFAPPLGPALEPRIPQLIVAMSGAEARAAADAMFTAMGQVPTPAQLASLIATLTSIGHFDLFTEVPVENTRRRDQYMYPLNTDYDLFSLGPNGKTAVSLGEKVAQDDVIRANNGGYYGPAYGY